jgi:hypothetical protein
MGMGIKNKLLVCVALLGFLFLLLIGSASAAMDFPADEAGISAYVKAKTSIPNLDVVKPCFATIERETDDYIIGTVYLPWHSEEQYPHVYVSTDGWVVAYYPNDRPSSWLLPWYYFSVPLSTTTLNETVKIVCSEINGTTTGLKYYDFRCPDATNMMLIVESIYSGSNWFNVTIPSTFTICRIDWSHYGNLGYWESYAPYSGNSYVYLDGTQISGLSGKGNEEKRNYGSFNLSTQFTKGVEHKVDISASSRSTGRVGLVLEYAE